MSKKVVTSPALVYSKSRGIRGVCIGFYPNGYAPSIEKHEEVVQVIPVDPKDAKLTLAELEVKYPMTVKLGRITD